METNFTAQQSLDTINSTLDRLRARYQQNGKWLMFWGTLVAIAGISQYILLRQGHESSSFYPWIFTMIPGFIINFVVEMKQGMEAKESGKPKSQLGLIWLFAGILAMVNGFVFFAEFGKSIIFVIYLPFIIASFAIGLYLKEKSMIIASILAVIIAYLSLYYSFIYAPLFAAMIGFVLMFIPGYILHKAFKARNEV